MNDLINKISYNLKINVVIRGSIAYRILTSQEINNKTDLDLLVKTEKDYLFFFKHLDLNFENVKSGEYQYKNKNLPRRKIELSHNKKNYNIDILIANDFFLTIKEKYKSIYLPSISDLLASTIIALYPDTIGINFENNIKKKKIFYQKMSNLSSNYNVSELVNSLKKQLKKQNEFYSTSANIYDLIFGVYSTFQIEKNDKYDFYKDLSFFELFYSISEELINSKDDLSINFYSSKDKYGCFSNFSLYPLIYDNKVWQTAEHCYQAQKFVDLKHRKLIRYQKTPKLAAQIGRTRFDLLRKDWDFIKVTKMFNIVKSKTLQNSLVYVTLFATNNKVIYETSLKDDFWGLGKNKNGKNTLGKIFMAIRSEIF